MKTTIAMMENHNVLAIGQGNLMVVLGPGSWGNQNTCSELYRITSSQRNEELCCANLLMHAICYPVIQVVQNPAHSHGVA